MSTLPYFEMSESFIVFRMWNKIWSVYLHTRIYYRTILPFVSKCLLGNSTFNSRLLCNQESSRLSNKSEALYQSEAIRGVRSYICTNRVVSRSVFMRQFGVRVWMNKKHWRASRMEQNTWNNIATERQSFLFYLSLCTLRRGNCSNKKLPCVSTYIRVPSVLSTHV